MKSEPRFGEKLGWQQCGGEAGVGTDGWQGSLL